MYLKSLRQLSKTLGARLVLWYLFLFTVSSTILFGVAYLLLSAAFKGYDRQILQAKIDEYAQLAQVEGTSALTERLHYEEENNLDSGIFIRLADPRNNTLVSVMPRHWRPTEASRLEGVSAPTPGTQAEAYVARDRGEYLAVLIRTLPDGTILQAAKRPELKGKLVESYAKIFVAIFIPIVLAGIGGGLLLSVRALRPIRDLIETVQSISNGRMDARVPSRRTGDELDHLVSLFNGMLGRIEALINGMREALDNVAHDLRTPITRQRNAIETALKSNASPDRLREALMDTAEEAERINSTLGTLMDISEAEKGIMELRCEETDLVKLIGEVVELYEYIAEDKGVTVVPSLPDTLTLRVDSHRIRQAVANLLDNAIKFTPTGGRIEISASPLDEGARITVADTGIGIPDKDIPRIFDRLFRGEGSRSIRGLGLGLSMVQAIVRAHRGKIESLQPAWTRLGFSRLSAFYREE